MGPVSRESPKWLGLRLLRLDPPEPVAGVANGNLELAEAGAFVS